jgi:hypothetical protein
MTLSLRKAVRKAPMSEETFSLPVMPPPRPPITLVPDHPIRIIDIANTGAGEASDQDLEFDDSPLDIASKPTGCRKGAWFDV